MPTKNTVLRGSSGRWSHSRHISVKSGPKHRHRKSGVVSGFFSSILQHVPNSSNTHRESSRSSSRVVDDYVESTAQHSFVRSLCLKHVRRPGIIGSLSNILVTGRCIELRCPELALTVFNNRPAYRMDLTLPAARQLLYTLHEGRQFSDVVQLAALFPLYNLPDLSSDPISCALFMSACLREANMSGSDPARAIAETLLFPFKQLLSQTPPMPVPVGGNRFLESRWMKDAMLSILDSLVVQGHEASWVRDWCRRSGYNLTDNI